MILLQSYIFLGSPSSVLRFYINLHAKTAYLNNAVVMFSPGGDYLNAVKLFNTRDISHNSLEYYQAIALYRYNLFGKKSAESFLDSLTSLKSINEIEHLYSLGLLSIWTYNPDDYRIIISNFNVKFPGHFYISKLKCYQALFFNFDGIDKTEKEMTVELKVEIDSVIISTRLLPDDLFFFKLASLDINDVIAAMSDSAEFEQDAKIKNVIDLYRNFPDITDYENLISTLASCQSVDCQIIRSEAKSKLMAKKEINTRKPIVDAIKEIINENAVNSSVNSDAIETKLTTLILSQPSAYEKTICKAMIRASFGDYNPEDKQNKFRLKNVTFTIPFRNLLKAGLSVDSLELMIANEFESFSFSDLNTSYDSIEYGDKLMLILGYICLSNELNKIEEPTFLNYSMNTNQLFLFQHGIYSDDPVDCPIFMKMIKKNPFCFTKNFPNGCFDDSKNMLAEYYGFQTAYPGSVAILKNRLMFLNSLYDSKAQFLDMNRMEMSAADQQKINLELEQLANDRLQSMISIMCLCQQEGSGIGYFSTIGHVMHPEKGDESFYEDEEQMIRELFGELSEQNLSEAFIRLKELSSLHPSQQNFRRMIIYLIPYMRQSMAYKEYADFYVKSLKYFHGINKMPPFKNNINSLSDTAEILSAINMETPSIIAADGGIKLVGILSFFNQIDQLTKVIIDDLKYPQKNMAEKSFEYCKEIIGNSNDTLIVMNAFKLLSEALPDNDIILMHEAFIAFEQGNLATVNTILNKLKNDKGTKDYFVGKRELFFDVIEHFDKVEELYYRSSYEVDARERKMNFLNTFDEIFGI